MGREWVWLSIQLCLVITFSFLPREFLPIISHIVLPEAGLPKLLRRFEWRASFKRGREGESWGLLIYFGSELKTF